MSALLERLAVPTPDDDFSAIRARARKALMRHGVPDLKTEAWKYTSLRRLDKLSFNATAGPGALPELPFPADVVWLGDGSRLPEALPAGVRVELNTAAALAGLDYGGREAAFAWLNLARMDKPWRLVIEQSLTRPLVLAIASDDGFASDWHPRVLIEVASGASATLIDWQVDRGAGLINLVQDIDLAENSRLDHMIVRHGHESAIIQASRVGVARDAAYHAWLLDRGGRLHRQDLIIQLDQSGSDGQIDGVALINSGQLVDCHSAIDHRVARTNSREAFRMLADGSGVGVFNGRIHIHRGADDSHSDLNTANLLLSESARINVKPELEIYAEEVTASHGATIGQLDDEALFYLRSRGLPGSEAAALLKSGFAALPLQAIGNEMIRQWILDELKQALSMVQIIDNPAGCARLGQG